MSSFVLNAPRVLSTGDSTCISKKPHCPKEMYSAVKRIFIHLNKHLEFFRNFEFFLQFVGRKILKVGKIGERGVWVGCGCARVCAGVRGG